MHKNKYIQMYMHIYIQIYFYIVGWPTIVGATQRLPFQ